MSVANNIPVILRLLTPPIRFPVRWYCAARVFVWQLSWLQ